MSKKQWIGVLTVAMLACRIECMSGLPAALAIVAWPGSLKHTAIEAERRAKRRLPRKTEIDFGCTVPFNTIPQFIEDGFL